LAILMAFKYSTIGQPFIGWIPQVQ
jgi:hypothetical protein